MKLESIRFVLENCDVITIDGKYVGQFVVDNISTSIRRIACNAIEKMDCADTFVIEIHKDANKERYQFDQVGWEDCKQMTFDRLTEYNDICSIDFDLVEDYVKEGSTPIIEHYDYYVNWVGDNEYENESQSSYISKDGNLYIVIVKGKKVEDFFDLEEINDSDYTEFTFDMYVCGDD